MKAVYSILRFFIGSFFIFSGFVKAIDPKGTEYKLYEYFTLSDSALNVPILANNALYISIFVIVFECLIGVFLLLGIFKKFTLTSFFVTILFFSFLTFYSAYYNKVTDCGCFGDFMKLEPWTSFYKDLVLLFFIIILIIFHRYYAPFFKNTLLILLLTFALFILSFVIYWGINHNPIIDFRPFAVGKTIQEGMKGVPEDRRAIYILKNSKTKEIKKIDSKTYTESNIWEDSLWVLNENNIKDSVYAEGIKPKINGFFITTQNGDETQKYLNSKHLLLIVFPEDEYCTEAVQKIYSLIQKIDKNEIDVLAIASKDKVMYGINTGTADDKIMKAMIRSTPGVLLLSKGEVIAKYHYNDVPNANEVNIKFKIKT